MTFYNRTRTSRSIPERLIKERRFHLLPLYYLLMTSNLAREGVAGSASYTFADHVYGARPAGRWGIGYLLDAAMLHTRSARAMRHRWTAARDEIVRYVQGSTAPSLRVLAVPCGLARELFAADRVLAGDETAQRSRVEWYGVDADSQLIESLQARAVSGPERFVFQVGDAFDESSYDSGLFSIILSTGFTEFLEDSQVLAFFRLLRSKLSRDGILITAALGRDGFSDYLLRNLGEIHTNYRPPAAILRLIDEAGFDSRRWYRDATGLQTVVVARAVP